MLQTHILNATKLLTANKIETPRLAAEMLMAHVLGCDRIGLLLRDHIPLSLEQKTQFIALVERHAKKEPTAYLVGKRAFFGRDFLVNPATLIPRPESEHLIEHALDALPSTRLCFADFGTGSGCLAVTLLAERPAWYGIAVDISKDALETAQENARLHGVENRLQCVQASFTKPLLQARSCDFIIANPPYISGHEFAELDNTVRLFEPHNALTPTNPNATGLECLASIIEHAKHALKPHGFLIMEHAYNQAEAVRVLCKQHNWPEIHTYQDLAGLDRLLFARI